VGDLGIGAPREFREEFDWQALLPHLKPQHTPQKAKTKTAKLGPKPRRAA
jgi:hypothetical protein